MLQLPSENIPTDSLKFETKGLDSKTLSTVGISNFIANIFPKRYLIKIVQLIEIIDDPGIDQLYIVMEYVQYTINDIPQPIKDEKWLRLLFRDMISGLEYLHQQRITHADIKPGRQKKT